MRHAILTCRNHPDLRWSCKTIAVTGANPGDPADYTGERRLFFDGRATGGMHPSGVGVQTAFAPECACPTGDLIIAPEDPASAAAYQKWLDSRL